jgi:hypothetical protein
MKEVKNSEKAGAGGTVLMMIDGGRKALKLTWCWRGSKDEEPANPPL